jgi:CBS domain containing-hemolysin-like protein
MEAAMTLFVLSVIAVLAVSAICSLTEAAFYGVRMPYVRSLEETGSKAGRVLVRFKQNMEQPIAAILILNTAANTAGSAIAGAQAQQLFGERSLMPFSVLFTLGVLLFAEIIPKSLGIAYNQQVARVLALPWSWIVSAMTPLIWERAGNGSA